MQFLNKGQLIACIFLNNIKSATPGIAAPFITVLCVFAISVTVLTIVETLPVLQNLTNADNDMVMVSFWVKAPCSVDFYIN